MKLNRNQRLIERIKTSQFVTYSCWLELNKNLFYEKDLDLYMVEIASWEKALDADLFCMSETAINAAKNLLKENDENLLQYKYP